MDMDFFLSLAVGILSSLVGAFLCFLIIYIFSRKNKIFISDRIAVGTNFSDGKQAGKTAWKFKIINKSFFVTFFNFDVKLISILKVKNNDDTFTQHRKEIPCICGVRQLSRYEPNWLVWLKRKINKKHTISFAYRPITFEDLEKGFREKKYDKLELSIICTDSMTGNYRVFKKEFDSTAFAKGEFSNDGDDVIIPCEVSDDGRN